MSCVSPPARVVGTELSASVEVSGAVCIARSGLYAECVPTGLRVDAARPGCVEEGIPSEEGMASSSLCWEVLGGFSTSVVHLHTWRGFASRHVSVSAL